MAGKFPLSMIQYKLLYGGTRKPHATKDEFVLAPLEKSRHIIVAHKNQVLQFMITVVKYSLSQFPVSS